MPLTSSRYRGNIENHWHLDFLRRIAEDVFTLDRVAIERFDLAAARRPAIGIGWWMAAADTFPPIIAGNGRADSVRAAALARPAARLQRANGTGRISASSRDGRTRLASLYQEGAAKIRLPRTHDTSLQAVLMNTAGGMTDGDRLSWTASVGAGSHLVLTTPACERIYRSLGADARIDIHLEAGPAARLDWLPQETILFGGARLHRSIDVELAEDASFLAVEAVLLGRAAMGEVADDARLRDDWRVRRGGRLVHAEAMRLSADAVERAGLSLLAGNIAFATIMYVGADAERRLAAIRALPQQPGVGSSAMEARLVIRAVAPSGLALRRAIVPIIASLSAAGALPRLWHV